MEQAILSLPSSRSARLVLLAVLFVASSVALAGDLPLKGVYKSKQSAQVTEDAVLRSDLEALRAMSSRTALWVFVAESRADWERHVGPGLEDALSRSPAEVARFAKSLPSGIMVLGPDLAGARVNFSLPDKRGNGAIGLHMPDLIRTGRADSALTNSRVPDQGRFLGAAEVKADKDGDGEGLRGLYVPSRPRPFEGGLPAIEARDLPRDGRGDLVIWAGRAESGSDGEDARDQLRGWTGRDDLPTQPMRSFPGGEERLARELRSMRTSSEVLVAPDGWYRALSFRPDTWEMERSRLKHPTRYVAGVAPVVGLVQDEQGRQEERVLVVGFVALYTPLLLTPEEAPMYAAQDARGFYEAVHRGELPFLRDKDDVWFLRSHLDRWAAREARTGGGKARTYPEATKAVFAWADRYRLRGVERLVRGPLPFRYQAIPASELEEMVDRRRAARGRVFMDDLAAWVRHADSSFDKGDLAPAYGLGRELGAVEIQATMGSRAAVSAVAARAPEPMEHPEDDGAVASVDVDEGTGAPKSGGLVKASDLGFGGGQDEESAELNLDDRGWESSEEEPGPAARSYGIVSGRMGGSVASVAETVAGIAIRDLFTSSAVCRIGSATTAGVELRLSGIAEGELEAVRVEWDLLVDGKSVRRDALEERREAGIHELEWDVQCPSSGGSAELVVAVFLGDDGPSDERTLALDVRSGGGRSYAALVMPAPKRCLVADLDLDADEEFGVSTASGLSSEQIGTAVRAFQEQTLRCYEQVADAAGSMQIELTVGCDGVVSDVEVTEESISDAAFVKCVADTMRFAPFPAHDRQGGAVFEIPLRYE